ncbi:hypothetical protein HanXRQr2_Chr05g0237521 [Helianthus annuus]|uniref:Uncharacterized protein n=1 Tax=Helianthus annuus TaxID=4232 RepID=A0A9K3NQ30_HELAN|nr:hypothetical protein HanXRQr2_Chr05g0237521 [Helianthus annuus]KAJ0924521.1 hypothetical protein HanPSC8_Chr05g0229091 [Helianthus annuus]
MLITVVFDVKIIASLSGNATIIAQKNRPIRIDISKDILVANIAPFALPAPSSFATRTLCGQESVWNHDLPTIRSDATER